MRPQYASHRESASHLPLISYSLHDTKRKGCLSLTPFFPKDYPLFYIKFKEVFIP